jgi:hypothetical protein
LFDPGGAILPPRPQFDCAIVSSGGQGWPHFSRPPEGLVLDGREHDGTLAASERNTIMRGSGARLVITAILAASRSRSRSLYRSPGTPIGKSINYLDFATIKLPAPAYKPLHGEIKLAGMAGEFASVPPQGGRKHPQQEFLQVDTTNILFVCGGAFTGLEKIISARGRSTSIGFGAKVAAPEDRKAGEVFREVEPEDLLKYGLIPEFVGRPPVLATLEDLDEPTLKRILVEPKNALVKQYHRLFEMESIELSFAEEALGAIARKAIERKTGRGACVRSWKAFCWTPCSSCRVSKASRKW